MEWSEAVDEYINQLTPIPVNPSLFKRILSLMDLTSLNSSDTEASVASFLEKAQSSYGHVAAVCVSPQFVRLAAAQFNHSPVKVDTVANFPEGNASLEDVLLDIGRAIQDGAQEVDVVFPYGRYLAGERHYAHTFVESCKAVCGDNVSLKIILETGALGDLPVIADAAYDVLAAGADFIKSSTGKITEGVTLEVATTMLLVMKHITPQLKRNAGVKVSGGIRSIEQAAHYIQLADLIMGRAWVTPDNFRIGASKLIDELTLM